MRVGLGRVASLLLNPLPPLLFRFKLRTRHLQIQFGGDLLLHGVYLGLQLGIALRLLPHRNAGVSQTLILKLGELLFPRAVGVLNGVLNALLLR